jgi:hypothetical protein
MAACSETHTYSINVPFASAVFRVLADNLYYSFISQSMQSANLTLKGFQALLVICVRSDSLLISSTMIDLMDSSNLISLNVRQENGDKLRI